MADQKRSGTSAVKRQSAAGACVLGALLLLGALLGPLWWQIAPRAEGAALGGGEVFTGTTEAVFAGEGYFVLITGLAGLVTGYTAYMAQFPLARRRFQDLRMACLVAGCLGSLGGALLTWRTGVALDGPAHAAVAAAERGATVQTGLQLDATAFLLVWPLLFVLQYGLLDAISFVRRDQPGVPDPVPGPGMTEPEPEPESEPEPETEPEAGPGPEPGADPRGTGPRPGQAPPARPVPAEDRARPKDPPR
ncbi:MULTISPECIES: hypothetical protein [Nocardiopsis]|uniref:DUF2567 domain-containing protein n=1 Tax=Nocardiopsis sinuspersici TaxID=501010 RepID=A0A1V3C1T6_9ACTN|nr:MULTISPECIES: hypothetical protein [Nocardiopsis]OOC54764.1 hypothetical protein NOSIN_13895 [Nocardiopsis sinuspersici]